MYAGHRLGLYAPDDRIIVRKGRRDTQTGGRTDTRQMLDVLRYDN